MMTRHEALLEDFFLTNNTNEALADSVIEEALKADPYWRQCVKKARDTDEFIVRRTVCATANAARARAILKRIEDVPQD